MTVGPVTYVYGPDGKRLKKISASGTTLYLGADVELANGVWTKYLHADVKVVGTGGAAVTSWLHRDHLASIRKITNASGAVAEGTAYKPYGRQTGAELTQSKTFIGEKWDPETGLMYLNARYYDPVLARFVTPDDWDPLLLGVGTNRVRAIRSLSWSRQHHVLLVYRFVPTPASNGSQSSGVTKRARTGS